MPQSANTPLTKSAPKLAHLFVDESKRRSVTFVCALIASGDVSESRKAVRQLLMPGQSHIHFTKESDRRRKMLLTEFTKLPLHAAIYEAPQGLREVEQRRICLDAIATDAVAIQVRHLLIERDDSQSVHDRRTLYKSINRHTFVPTLEYRLVGKRDEPLLWVADGIAWAWTHADWRQRIASRVIGHRRITSP